MKSNSAKRLLALAASLVTAMLLYLPQRSWADTINFETGGNASGTFSYSSMDGSLMGSNITIATVTDKAAADTYNILGGVLNFTGSPSVSFSNNVWTMSRGGSYTITGCVDIDASGTCNSGDVNGTLAEPLLSGTFNNGGIIKVGNTFFLNFGHLISVQNADLLAAFKTASPTGWKGNSDLDFFGTEPDKGAIMTRIEGSGVVLNSPVPEPATLCLLGIGLLAAGVIGRKKLLKTKW